MYDYLFYKFYARGESQEYVLDKEKSIAAYKGYMVNRLMKMFHYEGLPKTIPQYMLEYYLLVNGSCVIAEVEGKPYAFIGSFGGQPDPYYRPTLYVVANPALKFNKTFKLWNTEGEISEEVAFMRNDAMWMGLNPLMSRYATLLAENVITLRTADIMLRVVALLTAPDDKTKLAAEQYLKDLESGKLGVIGENRFFEGVKMQSPPSNNGSYLTQFIELQQYYKGSFFNEIGLSASFNMKREAIGEGEATLNEDTLAPLIDTMLECRQEDVSRLNDLFGLNIKVEFDSAWKQNIEETRLNMLVLESDADDGGNEDGEFGSELDGAAGSGDGSEETAGAGFADSSDENICDSDGHEDDEDCGDSDRDEESGDGEESDTSGSESSSDDEPAGEPVDNNINIEINVGDVSQLTEEGDEDDESNKD